MLMLESDAMIRRTTLSAEAADLAVMEAEARRRGISLSVVLKEVVAEAAAAKRAGRPRPRWGTFDGPPGLAQLAADDEDAPVAGI
jgi:hypothetical protein